METSDFPLEKILWMYCLARSGPHSLYLDHFAGLRALISWLGPIETAHDTHVKISWFESSYEIQRLAVILGCSEATILNRLSQLYYGHNLHG